MAQVEHITINNASRKVLDRMRQIGHKKAERLQKIQEQWDAGKYLEPLSVRDEERTKSLTITNTKLD